MNRYLFKFLNLKIAIFQKFIKLLTLFFFFTPKIFKIINFDHKNRFYRSILIKETVYLLKKILKSFNYNLPIIIDKDNITIDVDGVLITPGSISRYYKKPHNVKYFNQAKYLDDLFDFSDARVFIDIGACIGEYSIYFAKKYQESKIYSIEANEENLKLFKENIRINKTEKAIKIIGKAITDIENQNYYVVPNTLQSEVIIDNYNSKQKTITLSSLISDERLDKIDFLKIDIEGSNYKIAQCVINNSKRINAIQYEFSKGPTNVFINLIDKVNDFYNFYLLEDDKFKIIDEISLKEKIKSQSPKIKDGFDVFFMKKEIRKN